MSGVVNPTIVEIVKNYLNVVRQHGVNARFAVLYGSQARGDARDWSDIDVVVLCPEFDGGYTRDTIKVLWRMRAVTDSRIEPVPCGLKEWESGDGRPIIEIARREGVEITLDDEPSVGKAVGK